MNTLPNEYTVTTYAPDRGRIDGLQMGRSRCHHTYADKEAQDSAYYDAQAGGHYGTAVAVVRNHAGAFVFAYVAQQQSIGVALERCDTLEQYEATARHFLANVPA